ncbi:hypothetical protein FA95DRAFT_805754 [Auriscalpium vulgare]|uniref:Uncharacterized protein n=1 Tax=Auriscalpium vulgare TaxID=40419 RepID=A0ACB8RB95_9AGAM|nr:hypothetical protein FA95DRAFT_805754 [Auriscalpium vulgare]
MDRYAFPNVPLQASHRILHFNAMSSGDASHTACSCCRADGQLSARRMVPREAGWVTAAAALRVSTLQKLGSFFSSRQRFSLASITSPLRGVRSLPRDTCARTGWARATARRRRKLENVEDSVSSWCGDATVPGRHLFDSDSDGDHLVRDPFLFSESGSSDWRALATTITRCCSRVPLWRRLPLLPPFSAQAHASYDGPFTLLKLGPYRCTA